MMKKLLPLIIFALALGSCHKDDDDTPDDPVAERTVLVYIAGENNLCSFSKSDLKEMKAGSKSLSSRQKLDRKSTRLNSSHL